MNMKMRDMEGIKEKQFEFLGMKKYMIWNEK